MQILKSFFLLAIANHAISKVQANNVYDSQICGTCLTCCNVDNSTSTQFTGKTIVQYTYPEVSLYGTYTIAQHNNGTTTTGEDYQYVVPYVDDFKSTFDRNVFVFTENNTAMDCSHSYLFYGSSANSTVNKKIPFVKDVNGYCTLDTTDALTRAEIAYKDKVYFAFNGLVDEGTNFNMMYDLSPSGLIVPIDDVIEYPYVIQSGSVSAVDTNGNGEFFIDVAFNVSDISVKAQTANSGTGCLSIDQLMANGNAYWLAKNGTNCNVSIISGGSGNATHGGLTYHLKIPQYDYQTCAAEYVSAVNGNLEFDFRLVLPRDSSETTETTDNNCYYFAENSNVQNITISMAQDLSAQVSAAYTNNFNTYLSSVEPKRCTPLSSYPTPHSKILFTLNATLPGTYGSTFSQVTLPTLDGLSIEWDTVNGQQPANIPCDSYSPTGNAADDYQVCQFNLRSIACEPTYLTTNNRCAFERNNSRLLTGFVLIEEMAGGQTSTYASADINLGLDNSDYDTSLCLAKDEASAIDVTDTFNVELDIQNYYPGYSVNWTATNNYTMNNDMIVRMKVGEIANSSFTFDSDLSLMFKTITIELSNPVTNAVITSYTWSTQDKSSFMDYSWSPYYKDPRFCTWYNAAATGAGAKCENFFVDGTRSNNHADSTWITTTMPAECQTTGTAAGEQDTNNRDHFLFTPRTWFQGNVNGYVDMKITATAVVEKCSPNARRLSQERKLLGGSGSSRKLLDPGADVVYISKDLIISFVTKSDGSTYVQTTSQSSGSWVADNKELVIIAAVLVGVIILGFFMAAVGKRRHYESMPYVISSAKPDF